MTIETQQTVTSAPPRSATFTLRTVFISIVLIAAALALFTQHREIRNLQSVTVAHGLTESGSGLSPREFRVQVRPLSSSVPPAVYEIVLETLGEASIAVADARGLSR
jgi:hypothetical protein